jgi:hypothetical protein
VNNLHPIPILEALLFRDDLAVELPSELYQFDVHFPDFGEIDFTDHDFNDRALLQFLKNVKAFSSPVPLDGITGVSDILKLFQDELRDDEDPVDEVGGESRSPGQSQAESEEPLTALDSMSSEV